MGQVNQITQQNACSSEELAATAEEMSGQAGQLQELMAFFMVDANATPCCTGAHRAQGRTEKSCAPTKLTFITCCQLMKWQRSLVLSSVGMSRKPSQQRPNGFQLKVELGQHFLRSRQLAAEPHSFQPQGDLMSIMGGKGAQHGLQIALRLER